MQKRSVSFQAAWIISNIQITLIFLFYFKPVGLCLSYHMEMREINNFGWLLFQLSPIIFFLHFLPCNEVIAKLMKFQCKNLSCTWQSIKGSIWLPNMTSCNKSTVARSYRHTNIAMVIFSVRELLRLFILLDNRRFPLLGWQAIKITVKWCCHSSQEVHSHHPS